MTPADPRRARRHNSLELHLLGWILGALALGSIALVVAVYLIVQDEMGEVFDESLRQVAIATASRDDATSIGDVRDTLPGLPHRFEEAGDFDVVTAVYARDGRLLYSSDPQAQVPRSKVTGLSHEETATGVWHVYAIVLGERVVEAAQRGESRDTLAAAAATKLLGPVCFLIIFIATLIIVALRRGLRPLDQASHEIATRREDSLDAIDAAAMPREIRPMVDEINALMRRLGSAISLQRQFVADAAHELRSPVTALRLQVQLLERAADADQRLAATTQLRLGVDRSQRLIEQLLDLSRAEPGHSDQRAQSLHLLELARNVITRYDADARSKDMALQLIGDENPVVVGNEHDLDILVDNLVGNAVRYAGPGATVQVVVGQTGTGPMLAVRDDGPGVPDNERERIFDRFYRGEALAGELRSSGSGLGLAIARAIAVRHGATLVLLPARPGGGAEFVVTFAARKIPIDSTDRT